MSAKEKAEEYAKELTACNDDEWLSAMSYEAGYKAALEWALLTFGPGDEYVTAKIKKELEEE